MMTWRESMTRILLTLVACTATLFIHGCNSSPRADRRTAPVEQIRPRHATRRRHALSRARHENVLYQTFGPELLVLEPRSNRLMRQSNSA
jgi:hypothetical protein